MQIRRQPSKVQIKLCLAAMPRNVFQAAKLVESIVVKKLSLNNSKSLCLTSKSWEDKDKDQKRCIPAVVILMKRHNSILISQFKRLMTRLQSLKNPLWICKPILPQIHLTCCQTTRVRVFTTNFTNLT